LGSFVFSSMSATSIAQGNDAHSQLKQANCHPTKYREQPDKIKQPARTHALGQPPPFNDYRTRNSPAMLPWAALFFLHFQQLPSPKVMKRIRKSSKQTITYKAQNNRTKTNSLHEHMH
jgi:hypothetical protein